MIHFIKRIYIFAYVINQKEYHYFGSLIFFTIFDLNWLWSFLIARYLLSYVSRVLSCFFKDINSYSFTVKKSLRSSILPLRSSSLFLLLVNSFSSLLMFFKASSSYISFSSYLFLLIVYSNLCNSSFFTLSTVFFSSNYFCCFSTIFS